MQREKHSWILQNLQEVLKITEIVIFGLSAWQNGKLGGNRQTMLTHFFALQCTWQFTCVFLYRLCLLLLLQGLYYYFCCEIKISKPIGTNWVNLLSLIGMKWINLLWSLELNGSNNANSPFLPQWTSQFICVFLYRLCLLLLLLSKSISPLE